ncbi:hypothetical protein EDD21DRAFT_441291 [Dissophora ornata]|nr:hypothetical protein BGZ58_010316 [Dissophora ornata]KAI8604288.1 hypothetical protein EDD21DRAFT_441291 [Dissophora ornata]
MFNWINSPQLPDKIETQAFQSISGGPTLRINAIKDRTHKMKLIPWEDILEVFPNAIYLRDANGIVMPARDVASKRITPRSIKLQADVVLEVVSSQDIPPTSTRPANITKIEDLTSESSAVPSSTSPINRRSAEQDITLGVRTSTLTAASTTAATSNHHQQQGNDDSDWSPFQANSSSSPGLNTSSEQNEVLRQEMIHRLELMSAEQEERLDIILKACQRPTR